MTPLAGIRVLDLTRLLPGACATLLLADLGAEVIKIEDPRGGDGMRHFAAAPTNIYFERLNRGKRSLTLDLRSSGAAAVLDALAATSDVIIDNFRPSTARRLGVDAASLHRRHPRLICASINGFGQTGPNTDRAAHDINYQALAGLLVARGSTGSPRAEQDNPLAQSATSDQDNSLALSSSKGEPLMPGPLIGDIGAAMQAALRIVAALVDRAHTGAGAIVDIAIYDAARAWAMYPTTADLASACYNLYETADGEWLALGALEPKFWAGFCERIGRSDLSALQHARGEEGARVLREVRAVMKRRTRDEWLAVFAGADVCLTTVNAIGDPSAGIGGDAHAPALGADTDRILEEAGIDRDRRAALRAGGVI